MKEITERWEGRGRKEEREGGIGTRVGVIRENVWEGREIIFK